MPKNVQTTTQLHSSHMQKSNAQNSPNQLQQYVNCELPDVQARFRKDRETRDQIGNIPWIIKEAREFQKNIYFVLLTMPNPLTEWITIKCGKFSEMGITDLPSS